MSHWKNLPRDTCFQSVVTNLTNRHPTMGDSEFLFVDYLTVFSLALLDKKMEKVFNSGRGPIDKISTVFCQNPTFASAWQNILSQRKASKSRTTTDVSPSSLLLIAKFPIASYYNSALAMQKFSVY